MDDFAMKIMTYDDCYKDQLLAMVSEASPDDIR